MSHASTIAVPRRSPWIITPTCDLLFLIGTPLAVVPLLAVLANQWFSPEQISLAVISFASVGHHLPGFMRAYGDRELFARFRWRFLLLPPLLLVVSLLFEWRDLNGLKLVVLFWATWHGLMQTYGFMRIYDLKRGLRDRWTARLDWALCFAIFAAGILFSESRICGIAETLWLSGIPEIAPVWLTVARWLCGSVTGVVAAAFIVQTWRTRRVAGGVSWLKILLALTTGFLYWSTGTLATDLLVGVAMFEVCHAVQYYAIVWVYNRRLADRVGSQFGWLGFLFRERWVFVGLYLAAILAFGSINLFSQVIPDATVQRVLIAVLSTSALLHFYYDGFIWKVREPKTSVNLNIDTSAADPIRFRVPGILHAAKWGAFFTLVFGLMSLEVIRRPQLASREQALLDYLVGVAPDLPELQLRLSHQARLRGDFQQAVVLAEKAVQRRPRSHGAHRDYGNALRDAGRLPAAVDQLRAAVSLAPRDWENHYELANTLTELQRWTEADASYRAAAELEPHDAKVQHAWGLMFVRQGDLAAAAPHFRRAVESAPQSLVIRRALVDTLSDLKQYDDAVAVAREGLSLAPQSAEAQLSLGKALVAGGRFYEAVEPLDDVLSANPDSAVAQYLRGTALVQLARLDEAESALQTAVKLDPTSADAYYQLGLAHYLTNDIERAVENFNRSIALRPDFPAAYENLGNALFSQDRAPEAQAAYEQAITLNPTRAETHYNFGLLLRYQGETAQARRHIAAAWQLGFQPPLDLAKELGVAPPRVAN